MQVQIYIIRNAPKCVFNYLQITLNQRFSISSTKIKYILYNKPLKHSRIANEIEDSLEDKDLVLPGMIGEEIESPFPPIVQSGGEYALKYSTTSDDRLMKYDCVVLLFGVRYRYYCTSMARTLMIRPSEKVKSLYSFLLTLYDMLLKSLVVDAKFCDIYNHLYSHIKSSMPQYLDYFVKNIGFITGLEFRESSMVFDSKNQTQIKPGMVFMFLLGFQNFPNGGNSPTGCVAVGETIGIDFDGSIMVLTESKRSLASLTVWYSDSPKPISEEDAQNKKRDNIKRQPVQEAQMNEETRKAHQAELRLKLNEEARRRLLENEECKSDDSKHQKTFDGAYKNPTSLPTDNDVLNLKIYVDRRAESVLLPIFGMSVPFHISCIKSVTSSVEGGCAYLRINFHTITGPASKLEDLSITYGKNVYVKEMIFRSPMAKLENSMEKPFNIVQTFNQIKELQKSYKARLQHENEMKGVVKQADLIINPMKNVPRLKDVQIRPQIGARKISGSLEAHSNGMRYVSSKGEKLDVLYDNIKHAIFQPCDHETVITIHFHLKSPIMIGKKKFEDVQFFNEIGSAVSDLGKLSNSLMERDEMIDEERDRAQRNTLKQMYKSFIEKVESFSDSLEFEVPFRELGFNGVPHKASVFLMPTTHCLVNIIEIPPFVVSLEEIELVHFERIAFGIKNFDLVIIYKDYKRKVSMISSIDVGDLESIKDWLNSCDIKYTESKQNLNWTKIMKTILDDPEDFFANGGWGFLDPDENEGDEDNADSVIEDEEYRPDSEEEVVEESETDVDYVSEESESDYPMDDESESGKSWTDLENEARMEDALRYGGRYSPPEKRKVPSKPFIDKRRKY